MNENNQNQGADILNLTWIERPNPNHFETFRLITFKPGSIFDITIESKPFSNFIPHLNECIMTFSRENREIQAQELECSLENIVPWYQGVKKIHIVLSL